MDHILRRWQLGGFVFTAVGGTLLHYVYDWSGGFSLLGVISSVNESVWEHMKLLFIPAFLFTLIEMIAFGEHYSHFWRSKLLGILIGLLLIPTLYYTYTGALGLRLVWLDISLFYIAAAATFFLETRLLLRHSRSGTWELPSMLLIWLLAFAFLIFTYFPPCLPVFQDPLTFTYGIPQK